MRWTAHVGLAASLICICVSYQDFDARACAGEPARSAVTFESDIQPLLTRFACNSGPCHGKSRGQNGFALSLLGFDAQYDYNSLVKQSRGRRISPASPEHSLLLQKALGRVPHGGGVRIEADGKAHSLLRDWIAAGAPRTPESAPKLVAVKVSPAKTVLSPKEKIELSVTAEYSDGSRRTVTDASAFQSNDSTIAAVDEFGDLKAGPVPGETAVMARYMNHIAVSAITIPLPGKSAAKQDTPLGSEHPVDSLISDKLALLAMEPSELSGDAAFHRRAFLRIIGRLPAPEETVQYLQSTATDKREQLIDSLLQRPEYGDFWANKWADLLRPNPYRVGIKATWTLDAWLRKAFRNNMPYDQFVRELVTAQGSTWKNGATVIYRDRPSTVEIGSSVSQLFLGVRLDCAKCHHHPFEVWSQDDFYGFAAFFARVGHQGGLSPPISGSEELIYVARKGTLKHIRTGQAVAPKTLTGQSLEFTAEQDPREALADWMCSPENPYMAQVMANRVWAELMGRGIVEPVDDIRATNPATNQPLLDFLAADFKANKYDVKQLIRTIATSAAFALSSTPGERNVSDVNNFSRYYRQRFRAEVLLDAVNDILGTQEAFAAMAPGSRATQIWTHRASSLFLDTFGRPDANQDPPCERTSDSTTPQMLHLMNSPAFNQKLSGKESRPAELAKSDLPPEKIVEQAYLLVYCRLPSEAEREKALAALSASEDRKTMVEDLFWALMNTPEFFFIN